MAKKDPRDLSVEELRWLLVEKRRAARQERLEQFRQSGRVILVAPDDQPQTIENWHTGEDTQASVVPHTRRRRSRRVFDGFLLVVEVAAVIGFLFILFNGLALMRELNRNVVVALEQQPTMTSTPLIMAVVLPSGHTPPNSPGGSRFNDAEIPEHLRPLVQSYVVDVPIPTPGPEQAIRLQIPGISVDAPVVQGDGWEQLKKGIGQHAGTADPGQNGNVVLSAHNDIFGEIFRNLDQLKPGDPVVLYTNQRAYTYVVEQTQIVAPTNVDVMAATGQPVVTLVSCYPYLVDTQRIVVTARLQSSSN
jgi:sortase A